MFTADLRARFLKTALVICIFSLLLVFLVILTQPVRACQIEKVDSQESLYSARTGGLSINNRHLRSDCYIVVFYLSPSPDYNAYYHHYSDYDAFALVIGGRYHIYTGRGNYALVRYRVFDSCTEAFEAAFEFTRQMAGIGLVTPSSKHYDPIPVCNLRGA